MRTVGPTFRCKALPAKNDARWERRIRIGNFCALCISTSSIIIGGFVGIHNYQEQARREISIKESEIRTRKYNDDRAMYFELIDAASAVGASTSREEAVQKFSVFTKIYFGKAHIYVIDQRVHDAKKTFYHDTKVLIKTEDFPSLKISSIAYDLSKRCRDALNDLDKRP